MIPAMRSLSVRYVGALYWSFTTLTTVGYGDISANTTAERVFAILGMVGGGLMFSVIISYIGTMMKSQTALDDNCKMKMLAVEKFTGEHMVPKNLRKELTRYFRTQYESMGNMTSQVLKDIPFDMREALVEKIYKDMIDRLAILQNCSRLGAVEFCSRLEESHLARGTSSVRRAEGHLHCALGFLPGEPDEDRHIGSGRGSGGLIGQGEPGGPRPGFLVRGRSDPGLRREPVYRASPVRHLSARHPAAGTGEGAAVGPRDE